MGGSCCRDEECVEGVNSAEMEGLRGDLGGVFTILLRMRKEETARPTSGSLTGLEEKQLP